MKKLVKEGQTKVAKASKIMKGVGDFAQAILSVTPIANLVIQSIPQAAPAAFPWAGVWIGLQVSNHHFLRGFLVSSYLSDPLEPSESEGIQP